MSTCEECGARYDYPVEADACADQDRLEMDEAHDEGWG